MSYGNLVRKTGRVGSFDDSGSFPVCCSQIVWVRLLLAVYLKQVAFCIRSETMVFRDFRTSTRPLIELPRFDNMA